MAKMYTLDGKLLTERPEIRIGEKIYAIDDRTSTVKKLTKIKDSEDDSDATETMIKLALGEKAAAEIAEMDLPFAAYLRLSEIISSAMTGESPDEMERRFLEEKTR